MVYRCVQLPRACIPFPKLFSESPLYSLIAALARAARLSFTIAENFDKPRFLSPKELKTAVRRGQFTGGRGTQSHEMHF
jgi:hypothetical protein